MSGRSARMARLARVRRAMADLAAADGQRARLAHEDSVAAGEAILRALGGDSPLHGLIVPTMARALRRNTRATERLRRDSERAAREAVQAEATTRVFERHAREARVHERRQDERLRLETMPVSTRRRRS